MINTQRIVPIQKVDFLAGQQKFPGAAGAAVAVSVTIHSIVLLVFSVA